MLIFFRVKQLLLCRSQSGVGVGAGYLQARAERAQKFVDSAALVKTIAITIASYALVSILISPTSYTNKKVFSMHPTP